jgi:hypothetical protein
MKAKTGIRNVVLLLLYHWHLEVSGQLHTPPTLPLAKRRSTHRIGGWVGPGAGLDG